MTTRFIDRPDDYENMRSAGTDGDEAARLIARVNRNGSGEIQEAADVWGLGNLLTGAYIPQADCFVKATTGQQLSIRTESQC